MRTNIRHEIEKLCYGKGVQSQIKVLGARWVLRSRFHTEKIFRRIYGPKYENGEWKSRTSRQLEEMSKGENMVKWITGQRISWLGHLERMEEDRMAKKIFTQELEGTRRRGRPRKRWKEEVERDLQVLGVRRWRESWWQIGKNGRTLFDRPKLTVGCSANGRRSIYSIQNIFYNIKSEYGEVVKSWNYVGKI